MTILLIVLLVMLLGGGGYMYNTGAWTGVNPIALVLLVILLVLLFSRTGLGVIG